MSKCARDQKKKKTENDSSRVSNKTPCEYEMVGSLFHRACVRVSTLHFQLIIAGIVVVGVVEKVLIERVDYNDDVWYRSGFGRIYRKSLMKRDFPSRFIRKP